MLLLLFIHVSYRKRFVKICKYSATHGPKQNDELLDIGDVHPKTILSKYIFQIAFHSVITLTWQNFLAIQLVYRHFDLN